MLSKKSTKYRQLETGTAMTKPKTRLRKARQLGMLTAQAKPWPESTDTLHTVMPPPLNRFRPSHDNRSK